MNLEISLLDFPAVGTLPLEIFERKGIGHPDTICDALAEELSRTLSHYYLDHFGLILHHNVDKILLCVGNKNVVFGSDEVLELIEVFLARRRTGYVEDIKVPLANDTSCCVGYDPLDALENVVLQVERHLNSPVSKLTDRPLVRMSE